MKSIVLVIIYTVLIINDAKMLTNHHCRCFGSMCHCSFKSIRYFNSCTRRIDASLWTFVRSTFDTSLYLSTWSEFHRTHYDSWHEHRENFTEDQLLILTDVVISHNYYAWTKIFVVYVCVWLIMKLSFFVHTNFFC